MEKKIHAILLYQLKLKHKAGKTIRNIILDQKTINERTIQHWFQKFYNGNESLEDEESLLVIDNNDLRAIIETGLT